MDSFPHTLPDGWNYFASLDFELLLAAANVATADCHCCRLHLPSIEGPSDLLASFSLFFLGFSLSLSWLFLAFLGFSWLFLAVFTCSEEAMLVYLLFFMPSTLLPNGEL